MRKRPGRASTNGRETTNGEVSSIQTNTPCYETRMRELRVGAVIVKRFRQRSDAQEIILLAFQEENWPRCIDDPLSRKVDQDAQERLRRAVDNLNRRQRVPLLHFRVLREGTGVSWEFLEESGATATEERR